MATETLIEGVKTFAAAGWSGSGIANSNTFIVGEAAGPITAGLDHATIFAEAFIVRSEFTSDIGGSETGNFKIGMADATTSVFRYRAGGGRCWVEFGATAPVNGLRCENLDVGGQGTLYVGGGTVSNMTQDGGHVSLNASVILTNGYVYEGSGKILDHATPITLFEQGGGSYELLRHATAITLNSGTLILDTGADANTTVTVNGGRLIHRSGNIATFRPLGGVIDWGQAKQEINVGTTSTVIGNAQFVSNQLVTVSNVGQQGQYDRRVSL